MHQYRFLIYLYTEAGAVGELFTTDYATNPEEARRKFENWNREYVLDEEGNKLYKKYRIVPSMLAYKKIENPEEYFKQFEA